MEKRLNIPGKFLPVKPLTLDEMEEAANKRVSLITEEFTRGFKFIRDYPKSVTFFGSSRMSQDNPLYKKASDLAKRIVQDLGYSIVTGGGPGIMEAGNRGAYEAGGTSLGMTIKLPHEQTMNPYLSDHIDFFYFFSRKVCLSFSAEAYVFFPGGYGTLNEFFEILTLVQTKKIEPVPVFLVGKEYWQPLDSFMKKELLDKGLVENDDIGLYTMTDDEVRIISEIKKAPVRNGVRYHYGVKV
ncbi:TIGR00730 family Rossman fold protein [Candidatus Parcubacteria bacterium]|nr:TIGR00730 family Rossman fold protein [Candidatus Parcubacteria bacterium]